MAISSTSTDYTDRKRDLSILHTPDPSTNDAIQVSVSFGRPSTFCAGLQKLIQRYVIILLTNLESQPGFPAFGTDLLTNLQSGLSPVDKLRASQLFNLASYAALDVIRKEQIQNPTTPKDERILSTSLEGIALSGGRASFRVKIETESETSAVFLVPLPK